MKSLFIIETVHLNSLKSVKIGKENKNVLMTNTNLKKDKEYSNDEY